VLGATILGIEGDEVVHCFMALMAAGASYKVLRDAMGIHPTVSELLPTLLKRLEPIEPAIDKIS
jgi:pyruvate/2-oxoglutarate dehydrogenase complex dihydrolipoamide dehydrogenase (E3) component